MPAAPAPPPLLFFFFFFFLDPRILRARDAPRLVVPAARARGASHAGNKSKPRRYKSRSAEQPPSITRDRSLSSASSCLASFLHTVSLSFCCLADAFPTRLARPLHNTVPDAFLNSPPGREERTTHEEKDEEEDCGDGSIYRDRNGASARKPAAHRTRFSSKLPAVARCLASLFVLGPST